LITDDVEVAVSAGRELVEQLTTVANVEGMATAGKVFVELRVLITDGDVEVAVSTGRELVEQLITVGNVEGMATAGILFVEQLITAGKDEIEAPAGKCLLNYMY